MNLGARLDAVWATDSAQMSQKGALPAESLTAALLVSEASGAAGGKATGGDGAAGLGAALVQGASLVAGLEPEAEATSSRWKQPPTTAEGGGGGAGLRGGDETVKSYCVV